MASKHSHTLFFSANTFADGGFANEFWDASLRYDAVLVEWRSLTSVARTIYVCISWLSYLIPSKRSHQIWIWWLVDFLSCGLGLVWFVYSKFGLQSGFIRCICLFGSQEWMCDYIGAKAAISTDKADYNLVLRFIVSNLSLLILFKWVWVS